MTILFFAASLALYYLVAIYTYDPCSERFKNTKPKVWSGDEPHYLIMIASLLNDGDLNLANNYQSSRAGGYDAGFARKGKNLDHHTLITDRRTGESALWQRVYGVTPQPCESPDSSCVGYKRVSDRFPDYSLTNPNFVERPWHAVPFPALLALLIAGARADAFEADAIYFVVFLSWLAGLITYACSLKVGLSWKSSLAVAAILYFGSPWVVYSDELFAMTFLGLLLIAALWAFLNRRFAIAAVLLSIASMQSEAFVAIIAAWVLYLYFTKQKRSALVFALTGTIAIIVASLLNILLVGRITLRGMWFVFRPVLWHSLLDLDHGLFPFVPWAIAAFVFVFMVIATQVRNRQRDRDAQVAAVVAAFLPMVVVYLLLQDTGGDCYGPRYWVPFMPWMAMMLVLFGERYLSARLSLLRPIAIFLIIVTSITNLAAAVMNPSQVRFWQQPPWYSLAILRADSDQVTSKVDCAYWLGSGCGTAMPVRAIATNPTPVPATALRIISLLACAPQITGGTEVMRLHIFDTSGEAEVLKMIAGRDTSEWSYDCKTTRRTVLHERAQVFNSYDAGLNGEPCEGHRYLTVLNLSKPIKVTKIEFEWLGTQAAISLESVSLIDKPTAAAYRLEFPKFQPPAQ